MKSGSESGVSKHRGQILHAARSPASAPSRWSSERVEEAAEQRAVARAGAADHDHHEQRQREARRRHLRRRAGAEQDQPDDAAERREERREHEGDQLEAERPQPEHLDALLVLADRLPDVARASDATAQRTTTKTNAA